MTSFHTPAVWGVVVPVKRLAVAKSRLASYGDQLRADLALAFAADVVTACLACEAVGPVLVVTDDPLATRTLRRLGAQVITDDPDAGLNPALAHGAGRVHAGLPRGGDAGVVTLSSDLPALRAADLAAALRSVPTGARAFVTDADARGTTLLAASAGTTLQPQYGAGSRLLHLASGAVELVGTAALRRDVDTPEDLREALRLGVGQYTSAVAARLL